MSDWVPFVALLPLAVTIDGISPLWNLGLSGAVIVFGLIAPHVARIK